MSSLIVSFVESSNHCILASSFLVLVWFSLRVLELMVILMTSLSSSKTEFACVFYDVFGVGGFTGLIRGRVITPLFVGIPPLPLLTITIHCFDATRRLVSNKLEFAQFGAHMQKLWQFLFSWKWFFSGPSGSTASPSGSTTWSSQP